MAVVVVVVIVASAEPAGRRLLGGAGHDQIQLVLHPTAATPHLAPGLANGGAEVGNVAGASALAGAGAGAAMRRLRGADAPCQRRTGEHWRSRTSFFS